MELTTIELQKITASKGMVLTNGTAFGKEVYLGINDDAENWYEITEEKYNEIQKLAAEAIENETI